MQSQKELALYLYNNKIIKSKEVLQAFLEINRADFVLEEQKKLSYFDMPLSIGYGQTISAPHMHALMIENLELEPQKQLKILEIGTGSGYLTALLKKICKKSTILSVESIKELALFAYENIKKANLPVVINENLKKGEINLINENGYFGLKKYSPYNRIIVGACYNIFPNFLIDQLKEGGVLIFPFYNLEDGFQHLIKIKKINQNIEKTDLGFVSFVFMQK